jgi:hypothetical protein
MEAVKSKLSSRIYPINSLNSDSVPSDCEELYDDTDFEFQKNDSDLSHNNLFETNCNSSSIPRKLLRFFFVILSYPR